MALEPSGARLADRLASRPGTPASDRGGEVFLNNVPSGAYAELPGVKLWFTDTGSTDVPIVLLHPNTGTVEIWQPQIAAFAAAGYRVIAFDRKGWGKSVAEPASGAGSGGIAGDLDALADHLKLDKFHLLGIAGGGFVALDYAAWRPQKLRSLIVSGSTGSFEDKAIADFIARIAIPEIRKQSALPGNRSVLSRCQPGRHPALDRDRRTCAPAGLRLSAATAHAEHTRQDRGHYRSGAGDRRGCRSAGAAGLDAHLGRAPEKSRMGRHPRCRPCHGVGAARRVQRQGSRFFAAALNARGRRAYIKNIPLPLVWRSNSR